MSELPEPVRVTLKITDWLYIPTRTHTRPVEIDREEWDDMSPDERREYLNEELDEFAHDCFEWDYKIENASLDDEVEQ